MHERKLTLLLHGPYNGNAYTNIFRELDKSKYLYKYQLNTVCVVYETDYLKTEETISKDILQKYSVQMIRVKDLVNPGFYNINRQIMSVSRGLSAIDADRFVIKLRNDQWVNFDKLFSILEKNNWLIDSKRRIITTNCYTRKDRFYHPSDMFLCGWQGDLRDYYDLPLRSETHVDYQMRLVEVAKNRPEKWEQIFECPESILGKNYLAKHGWKFKYTLEDSYNALDTHFLVLNSWNIGYCWNKKRNPVLDSGSIILPCYFEMAPFPGAPVEKARCYRTGDFSGCSNSLKDLYYCLLSRMLFRFQLRNKQKLVSWGYKILNSKYMPRWLINILVKTKVRTWWIRLLNA